MINEVFIKQVKVREDVRSREFASRFGLRRGKSRQVDNSYKIVRQ